MSDLRTLVLISQTKYEIQQQNFRKIIQEEASLRQELNRLFQMGQMARRSEENFAPMRAIGADMIWESWLGRKQTELNLKLARVLAKKEYEQSKVRQAFGRMNALVEIIQEGEAAHKKNLQKLSLDLATNQAIS